MDKTIIWDFDGTLGYREGNWEQAIVELIQEDGSGERIDVNKISKGLQEGFPWHKSETFYPELRDPSKWWASVQPVFRRIFLDLGFSEKEAGELGDKVPRQYTRLDKWHLYEEAKDSLLSLSAFDQYLVSNHIPELPLILEQLGIKQFFEEVIVSSLVGYNKPNPRIVSESISGYQGRNSLYVVGDRYESDILFAQKINAEGILVRHFDDRCRLYFDSLEGVKDYLLRKAR